MAAFTPRQTSRTLNGKQTQVFLQTFADRVLVLVTQMGKVGNLIQATLPPTASLIPPNQQFLPEPSPAVQLVSLLGSSPTVHRQTLYSLYASQIATIVWTEESQVGLYSRRRGVIVGLALHNSTNQARGDADPGEREVFEGVMAMVYDLLRSE